MFEFYYYNNTFICPWLVLVCSVFPTQKIFRLQYFSLSSIRSSWNQLNTRSCKKNWLLQYNEQRLSDDTFGAIKWRYFWCVCFLTIFGKSQKKIFRRVNLKLTVDYQIMKNWQTSTYFETPAYHQQPSHRFQSVLLFISVYAQPHVYVALKVICCLLLARYRLSLSHASRIISQRLADKLVRHSH